MTRSYAPRMNEKHVKGRKAGVRGTYGEDHDSERTHKGKVTEATVLSKNDAHVSGGEDGLPKAVHSMYEKAVKNRGDNIGDKALTER